MQDERLIALGFDGPSQLRLIRSGIDMRITVVLEDAEVPIEADINARRLHHVDGVRLEPNAAGVNFSLDVAVGEQHAGTISRRTVSCPV
jgi:hypothetical protein